MRKFKEIEHTADLCIEVWGNNLEELFLQSASGMYSLIFNSIPTYAGESIQISFNEENLEELLVSFLNELNYYIFFHEQLPMQIRQMQLKRIDNFFHLS